MSSAISIDDLDPSLQTSVLKAQHKVTSTIGDKGLLSLYMGGTISKKDRIETSDIDLIGIVSDEFDFIEERDLNRFFRVSIDAIGCEARFRCMTTDEIKGGPPRGYIAAHLPVGALLKRLPFFIHLWGTQIDISETIGPISPQEEAMAQVDLIRSYINRLRNGERPTVFFSRIAKIVLHLSAVEAEVEFGYNFDPSFHKVVSHLSDQTDHIAHEALRVRHAMQNEQSSLSEDEKRSFLNLTENYLEDVRKRALKWST